jgi:carbon monoxide dehydrogenase subunit G
VTHVEGERLIDAPPERVYEALLDHDTVVSAIPVLRSTKEVDADRWEAKVKAPVRFGPSVTVHFAIVERRPPEHASVRADGAGAHVTSSFDLEPEGHVTRVRWRADLELGGLLASFAGPRLEPIARRAADRVLDRVAAAAAAPRS